MTRPIHSILAANPGAVLSLLGKVSARALAIELLLAGVPLTVRLDLRDRRQGARAEVRREMEIVQFQWPAGDRTWAGIERRRVA